MHRTRHRLRPLAAAVVFLVPPSWLLGPFDPYWTARHRTVPSDEVLEARDVRIGEVVIRTKNIFDPELPGENRAIYRLANRLHRTTRPRVIRQQLLFRSGDPFSRRILDESERLLRQYGYLYDADIRPIAYDGETVDLEVITRDVWTLKAGVSIGRSGGENSYGFKLEDTNLLGTGKSLTLEQTNDVDRTRTFFRYADPHLMGSRTHLSMSWSENSDGDRRTFELARPFYSLDSRWSLGLRVEDDDRLEGIWQLGRVKTRFRHEQSFVELFGGLSSGSRGDWTRRWTFGFTHIRDDYESDGIDDLPSAYDRELLSYPWVGFEYVEDKYLESRNLDQMDKTEDLPLGRSFSARLGLSSSAWGGDDEALVFQGAAQTGYRPGPEQTLLLRSALSGFWAGNGLEETRLDGEGRYYWRNFGKHLFFASVSGTWSHALDPEDLLYLGGETGLRGYPFRFQSGRARFLATVEQRFYTGWHPFKLGYVGGAVFADAGRAWERPGDPPSLGILKDIGVGLRLSSSRAGGGKVIHLDVAFPLDRGPSVEGLQWLVTTKSSF